MSPKTPTKQKCLLTGSRKMQVIYISDLKHVEPS